MNTGQELTVRRAGTDDVDALVAFSSAMAWETEHRRLDATRLREGTQALLSTPSLGFFMVMEVREPERCLVVGQLMITYEWSDWRNGNIWWIQSVYVKQEFRGHGVFKALFEHVEQLARSSPEVCALRLYMDKHNEAARRAYAKLGMVEGAYVVFEKGLGRRKTGD